MSIASLEPAAALSWSEATMDSGPADTAVIALWMADRPCAAIGLSQDSAVVLDAAAMKRDRIGLVRRQSGGGAVLLYPGVLCWEAWAGGDVIAAGEGVFGIRETYRFLCRPVVDGLRGLGVEAFQAGICDISTHWRDDSVRKLAGTAQLRRRERALVHGSLLVHADIAMLERYLPLPSDQPEYRAGRTHRDFCLSVAEALSATATTEFCTDIMALVAGAIRESALAAGWEAATPSASLDGAARALYDSKYSRATWNWEKKRTP